MSISFLAGLLLAFSSSAQASESTYASTDYAIAARYAPVMFQQTGSNPKGDAITRVDFDGDWSSNNNWDNLDRFGVPAYVYYSVAETQTHYFITYAFFHPRDYSVICLPFVCHENDMEGAGLTVEKTANGPGRVVHLETKAHGGMGRTDSPPFVGESDPRVALFIEKQGHGVYGWNPRKKGRFLVYRYTGTPEDPQGAKEGQVGYDLLPIETTIWAQRHSIGYGQTFSGTYDYEGTRYSLGPVPFRYAGEKWTRNVVTPPWSWTDGGAGNLKKGDWFFDPALAISRRANLPRPISLEYLHNPYLGIYRD